MSGVIGRRTKFAQRNLADDGENAGDERALENPLFSVNLH
jgi:hypothetical protein